MYSSHFQTVYLYGTLFLKMFTDHLFNYLGWNVYFQFGIKSNKPLKVLCVFQMFFSRQHQHYRNRIIQGDPTGRFHVHLNVESGILSKGDLSCSHGFTLHIHLDIQYTSLGGPIVNGGNSLSCASKLEIIKL